MVFVTISILVTFALINRQSETYIGQSFLFAYYCTEKPNSDFGVFTPMIIEKE